MEKKFIKAVCPLTFISNVFLGLSPALFRLFQGTAAPLDLILLPLFFYGAIFSIECLIYAYREMA